MNWEDNSGAVHSDLYVIAINWWSSLQKDNTSGVKPGHSEGLGNSYSAIWSLVHFSRVLEFSMGANSFNIGVTLQSSTPES